MANKIHAGLIVTALVGLASVAPVLEAESVQFQADWYGESYSEDPNPLDRFTHFSAEDADGDGFPQLDPLPLFSNNGMIPLNTSGVTNSEIERQMRLRGITRENVIAQIDLVLSWNASYDRVRTEARQEITTGNHLGAADLLVDTPASVRLFCGPTGDVRTAEWIVSVPIPIDCDADGSDDLVLWAVPTYAGTTAATAPGINDLSVLFHSVLLSMVDGPYMTAGMGYGEHNMGLETRMDKDLRFTIELTNMLGDTAGVYVNFEGVGGTMKHGDGYFYTFDGPPTEGRTVWATQNGERASFWLRANVWGGCCRFVVEVELQVRTAIKQLDFGLTVDSTTLHLAAAHLPKKFGVEYQKILDDLTYSGPRYYARVWNPDGAALRLLELAGTYTRGESAAFTFGLVGLPAENELLISPGNPKNQEPSCDEDHDNVFSLDLTKGSAGTAGRYRSIIVTGHRCGGLALDIAGNDLHRVRLVNGKHDYFRGDGHKFFELGANVKGDDDGALRVHISTPDIPLFGNARASITRVFDVFTEFDLRVQDFDLVTGYLGEGDDVLREVTTVNAYFWHISEDQLAQSECKPVSLRYPNGDCV